MIKSGRSALLQKVEKKKVEIEETLGRKIFTQEEIVTGMEASDFMPGMSICFKENRPDKAIEFLRKLLESGADILSISRLHPDQIRGKSGVDSPMVWLTKSERTVDEENIEFVSPTNLPVLAESIQQFLNEKTGGVVFLEGLEYLCTQNDFKSVLKFIQLVNEQVVLKKGYLIISVNPSTMDSREFSLFLREMSEVA